MSIAVVNRHTYQGPGIYVGRPSALGNPYRLTGDMTRTAVIAQYRAWLRAQWRAGGPAKTMLRQLAVQYQQTGQLVLICSCAPRACHADVIKEAIEGIVARQGT